MLLLTQLLNGLNASAVLLIASLGVVVIMGHMKVVNLAHGECIMLGAYASYYSNTVLGLPFVLSLVTAFFATGLIGLAIERLIIRKLYGKAAETLLATYALSLVLKQLVKMLCGPELKYVKIPYDGAFKIGNVVIPQYNVLVIAIAVVILLITGFLFFRTRFGKKMRAINGNRSMTECLGINTSTVDLITFAYGVALAGLAGAVMAPVRGVSPFMGEQFLTDSFINVVVGGLNSLIGTTLSSALIGGSMTLLGGFWNEINAKILVFLIVIVLIRFKPNGLFRKESR